MKILEIVVLFKEMQTSDQLILSSVQEKKSLFEIVNNNYWSNELENMLTYSYFGVFFLLKSLPISSW